MAHREDTCWGKAKYRVVVTQILATRVEAFGLPAAADWHVTPPPAAQASVLVGTVTFRYLLNLTQQAREERQESGTCQERPFCQGSHTLGLLEPPAPPVPTGSLSDTFA